MILSLFSCGSYQPSQIAKPTPRFIPEEVFDGKLSGEGSIFNRFGKIQTSFVINLEGSPNSKGINLKEELIYDNGKVEYREYNFTKLNDNSYKATADSGLVGEAQIESVGNILRWKYTFEVPYRGKVRHMQFDDWMYLQDNGTIINRAKISWWNFKAAELFMVIKRVDGVSSAVGK